MVAQNAARFRLWAPDEERLTLRVDDREAAMHRTDDGWFELDLPEVAPGARYQFVLADGFAVPDPAARAQDGDVHGPSLLVDPTAYRWEHPKWRGRPWEETVIYELHVGTFTPEGTFAGARERLGHLAELGVTAVELMPVAQFAGDRGWGYDGVLHYAPHRAYGTPDDLKAFVDAAHGHGLMVLLDVVYNHFGPEGNYLSRYASRFFHPERHTPWGAAIAYERAPVRRFFVENALYWLQEYMLDGLRLDAIDHILDEESEVDILVEIAREARATVTDRHIHLTTEDNRNITRLHERDGRGRPALYTAEWNDDLHNVAHVIATGESDGYYADFTDDHWGKLARALAEGFAYQGEPSRHGGGGPRGAPSAHLPPAAFIDFLQNHDQVGNRAFGERLITIAERDMVKALTAMLLLSPHIPLIFMGEEFGETRPFCFFTDFHGELADAVRIGRRKEFAGFAAFQGNHREIERIPDPNAATTFEASLLDWDKMDSDNGRDWCGFIRGLLALRHARIVPLLGDAGGDAGRILARDDGSIAVDWQLGAALLELRANLTDLPRALPHVTQERLFMHLPETSGPETGDGTLPPYSVIVAVTADQDAGGAS